MHELLNDSLHLDKLADPASAEVRLVKQVQGNILKFHRRRYALHGFFHIDDPSAARVRLRDFGDAITTTHSDINDIDARLPLVSISLSYAGYRSLGIERALIPADSAFRTGMRERGHRWLRDDTNMDAWEPHFKQDKPETIIHGMILVAVSTEAVMTAERTRIVSALSPAIRVLGWEEGRQIYDVDGHSIEHFRFLDGLSGPVFLRSRSAAPDKFWKALFPLSLVLERCGKGEVFRYGSYLVFRKLEQNARKFAELEQAVAAQLCLTGAYASEVAGAMLLGRFRNGTPLALWDGSMPRAHASLNDFDYSADPDGARCPVTAHIRKVNPRGSSDPAIRTQDNQRSERPHLIARRGITYGMRDDHRDPSLPASQRPNAGIGLLFMCYQASIVTQFEHMQREWANWLFHPVRLDGSAPGVDSVIGQGQPLTASLPSSFPDQRSRTIALDRCITFKGGEYFFTPSIDFFRSLI